MTAPPPREAGELADWEPIGRPVRTGTWAQQAEPTPDRIEQAIAEGRGADAAALIRHLPVEASEIDELYDRWVEALGGTPVSDFARFAEDVEALADRAATGRATTAAVEALCARWRADHDRRLAHVADLLDRWIAAHGEERLGELWADLQADGIAAYARYDTGVTPWPASFDRLVQVAIEGMHGHLGGPRGRGEVAVVEHDDRIDLTFAPCGSGGRILAGQRHARLANAHDFGWNTPGVCAYCVHCCVLQQLTPIDRFGYPARVITPPVEPGQSCTWTVYRDPALVPDEAYERVGRTKPR